MEYKNSPTYDDPLSHPDETYQYNFPAFRSDSSTEHVTWPASEERSNAQTNAQSDMRPIQEQPQTAISEHWQDVSIDTDAERTSRSVELDRFRGIGSSSFIPPASASAPGAGAAVYLDQEGLKDTDRKISPFGSPFSQRVAIFVLVASIGLLLCTLLSGFFGVIVGGLVNLATSTPHVLTLILAIIALSFDCLCHAGLIATSIVGISSASTAFNTNPNVAIKRRYFLAKTFVALLLSMTAFYVCLSFFRVIPGIFGALFFQRSLSKVVSIIISTGALLCCSFGICGIFIVLGMVQMRIVRKDFADLEKGRAAIEEAEAAA